MELNISCNHSKTYANPFVSASMRNINNNKIFKMHPSIHQLQCTFSILWKCPELHWPIIIIILSIFLTMKGIQLRNNRFCTIPFSFYLIVFPIFNYFHFYRSLAQNNTFEIKGFQFTGTVVFQASISVCLVVCWQSLRIYGNDHKLRPSLSISHHCEPSFLCFYLF